MEKKNRDDSVAKTEMPMINIKKKNPETNYVSFSVLYVHLWKHFYWKLSVQSYVCGSWGVVWIPSLTFATATNINQFSVS